MSKHLRPLIFAILAGTLAGCGMVYKPVVQQGNLIDKKHVGELKIGMTKRQVMTLLDRRE